MKRFCLLIVGLSLVHALSAQLHSEFTLGVQGGVSQWGYQALSGQAITGVSHSQYAVTAGMDVAAGAQFGYKFFFCPWVGIGIGADVMRYGSRLHSSGEYVWDGVTDTNDERYNHHLKVKDWKEHQHVYTLEVPLTLAFRVPGEHVEFVAEIGGKWGLPLQAGYSAEGKTEHTGYYPYGNVWLHNIPEYGFYSQSHYTPKGELPKMKMYWAAVAKAGVAVPFGKHWAVSFQAVGTYVLTDMLDNKSVPNKNLWQPGYRLDAQGMDEEHYFMGAYQPYLSGPLTTGKVRPWSVGLEVGVKYMMPHKAKSKCPCRVYLWS